MFGKAITVRDIGRKKVQGYGGQVRQRGGLPPAGIPQSLCCGGRSNLQPLWAGLGWQMLQTGGWGRFTKACPPGDEGTASSFSARVQSP